MGIVHPVHYIYSAGSGCMNICIHHVFYSVYSSIEGKCRAILELQTQNVFFFFLHVIEVALQAESQ